MSDTRADWRLDRREALELLGLGGLGLALTASEGLAAAPLQQDRRIPRGAVIRTVLQDIGPDSLGSGQTLFHEHVLRQWSSPPAAPPKPGMPPPPPDPARVTEILIEELKATKHDGIGCIVDAATSGRRTQQELDQLRAASKATGVQLVMAGGYLRPPKSAAAMSEAQMIEELMTDVRALRLGAFGEIGFSEEVRPEERTHFNAVAKVHLQTGLPIFTHTPHDPGTGKFALEQLELFESHGVNLSNLCIGHMSGLPLEADPRAETHKAIARRGAFLGFDTLREMPPNSSVVTDAQKVRTILEVLEAGYEDFVLLSTDFSTVSQGKTNYGNGFSTVFLQFVPKLRYAGVKEPVLRKLLVDNPRRFLSFVPKA